MENDSANPTSDRHSDHGATSTSILPITATADDVSPASIRSAPAEWPTIDGPLGLSHEESLDYARSFFKLGFLCLPFLWAINCFYFWPILRHPHSHRANPRLRHYLVGSAIGFTLFTAILSSWALTFAIGGEQMFGHVWKELVMYNLADKYGLTGWI